MLYPPVGFIELENFQDYILQTGDRFAIYEDQKWWDTVSAYAGYSPKTIRKKWGDNILRVAVKSIEKPRFKCDKPYPYGY